MRYFDFTGEKITCLALNSAGRKLFIGNEQGKIKVFNASTLI